MTSEDNPLEQFARLIAPYVAAVLGRAGGAPSAHSQVDGQRPIGVGRDRYLRGWRRGRDAADPEVWGDGRARCMTAAAWQRHGASAPKFAAPPALRLVSPPRSPDADVLAELGLSTKVGGR